MRWLIVVACVAFGCGGLSSSGQSATAADGGLPADAGAPDRADGGSATIPDGGVATCSGDWDHDGICDDVDPCPGDADNDPDGDGICARLDNCRRVANADQQDSDADLVGDACDDCPTVKNRSQGDSDADGIGDACETAVNPICSRDGVCTAYPLPTGEDLRTIRAVAADDVWIVRSGGRLLRHDGRAWSDEPGPGGEVHGAWTDTRGELWSVGDVGKIGHFLNGGWTVSSVGSEDLRGIWGSAGTVFAVGDGGAVYSRAGSGWARAQLGSSPLAAIGGTSARDVWAGGGHELWHFDGASWRSVPLSVLAAGEISSISATGGTVFVSARTSNGAALLTFDGTTWTRTDLGGLASGDGALSALSATDAWFAGGFELWHWDGHAWTRSFSAPTYRIAAVLALSPTDVRAVGEAGQLWDFDGATWRPLQPESPVYSGAFGTEPEDVWAVGAHGWISHFDGLSWKRAPSPVGVNLTAVHADGSETWIAGDEHTLLRSTGSGFTEVAHPRAHGPGAFEAVFVRKNRVFAVGDTIVRFDGARWHEDDAQLARGVQLHGVWAASQQDVWAVGDRGTIRHFDGTAWAAEASPVDVVLHDVWGVGADDVWAVGDAGTVLHRGSDGLWKREPVNTTSNLYGVRSRGSTIIAVAGEGGTYLEKDPLHGWWAFRGPGRTVRRLGLQGPRTTVFVGDFEPTTWGQGVHTDRHATLFGVQCGLAGGEHGLLLGDWGGGWRPESSGTEYTLRDVFVNRADSFVAGDHGVILESTAGGWRNFSKTTTNISGLYNMDSNSALYAGEGGEVGTFFQGAQWAFPADLFDIRGTYTHVEDVFAVGASGTLLHYGVDHWDDESNPMLTAGRDVLGVWANRRMRGEAWAVGRAGLALHRTPQGWSRLPDATPLDLDDVWAPVANDVWAVGGGPGRGVLVHWDGVAWHELEVPGSVNLHGIHGYRAWNSATTRVCLGGERASIFELQR